MLVLRSKPYVHTYIYIYIYTYVHIYIYIYAYMQVHLRVAICVHQCGAFMGEPSTTALSKDAEDGAVGSATAAAHGPLGGRLSAGRGSGVQAMVPVWATSRVRKIVHVTRAQLQRE